MTFNTMTSPVSLLQLDISRAVSWSMRCRLWRHGHQASDAGHTFLPQDATDGLQVIPYLLRSQHLRHSCIFQQVLAANTSPFTFVILLETPTLLFNTFYFLLPSALCLAVFLAGLSFTGRLLSRGCTSSEGASVSGTSYTLQRFFFGLSRLSRRFSCCSGPASCGQPSSGSSTCGRGGEAGLERGQPSSGSSTCGERRRDVMKMKRRRSVVRGGHPPSAGSPNWGRDWGSERASPRAPRTPIAKYLWRPKAQIIISLDLRERRGITEGFREAGRCETSSAASRQQNKSKIG